MKNDNVKIKKSDIEGLGIFASRDFKRGEVILRWDTTQTLPKKIVEAMSDSEKKYISCLGGKYIIMQKPERCVNHSCEPNTAVKDFCDVALRDIKKDEEITSDYAAVLPANTYMECNCGSKNCKKTIRS